MKTQYKKNTQYNYTRQQQQQKTKSQYPNTMLKLSTHKNTIFKHNTKTHCYNTILKHRIKQKIKQY